MVRQANRRDVYTNVDLDARRCRWRRRRNRPWSTKFDQCWSSVERRRSIGIESARCQSIQHPCLRWSDQSLSSQSNSPRCHLRRHSKASSLTEVVVFLNESFVSRAWSRAYWDQRFFFSLNGCLQIHRPLFRWSPSKRSGFSLAPSSVLISTHGKATNDQIRSEQIDEISNRLGSTFAVYSVYRV